MKEKLLAKLNELLEKRKIAIQNHDNTKALEQHEYRVEEDVLIDTIKKLQLYFAMACPEDKKEEMHSILEEIQRAKFGDDAKFQRFKVGTQNHPDVKSEYEKKFYMFFHFPTPLIEDGGLHEFFEKVGDYLDEEGLDKVIQDIDNYKSPYIHNVKVYFWRDRIDALKKKNEERVEDAAKRQELNDELESIANLVVTSDRNYSATNGDIRDQVLTKIGNDRMEAANKQSLTDGKYNHLNKYFCTSDTKNDGTRSIHEVRIGDVNLAKDFNLDQAKMIIPEDRQNAIKEVFKYMRDKGIFDDNANTNEGAKKIYGFVKLYEAHEKLSKAIDGTDVEAIRAAKAEYNRQLENMRGLYALIKEQFNLTEDMMLSNITSFRETWIPNEFKNKEDLVTNVYVNALFALNATLQTNNVSLDQLFEDPSKAFFGIMRDMARKLMPNNHLSHDSVSDAIAQLAVGESTGYFSQHGLPRNLEFLLTLSVNRPEYEQNAIATMLLQTYSIYITELSYRYNFSKVENYLDKNAAETIANILLVNPADRDYNKLKAVDDLTYDAMERIPAFDTLEYLKTHTVPANELVTRLKTTIAELAQKDIKSKINMTKSDMLLRSVEAAQLAAIQYLAVHPTPEAGVMSKSEYNALKQIAEKPEVAFAKSLNKIYIDEKPDPSKKQKPGENNKDAKKRKTILSQIAESRTYQKLNENSKEKIANLKRDAKNAENLYNARMDALNNRMYELKMQLLDQITDAEMDEITKEFNALESEKNILPDMEIARLEREYMQGKLTKDYFEERKQNLQQKGENYKDFVPFGTDDYPSFDEFKKQYAQDIKDKTITKTEVQAMYNTMIAAARFEEQRLGLMHAANHPKPYLANNNHLNTWFLSTREAAREAELVYRKNLAEIDLKQGSVIGDIKKAKNRGADTAELDAKYEMLKQEEAELINTEIQRLDNMYLAGLLPRDYYEQRKLDIQSGKSDNKVPFGTDEYPSFDEFKQKYAEDLEYNELSMEDVYMFYDRMMENARMTEANFMLTASNIYPEPTLDAPEEFRYHIEVPEISSSDGSKKSPEVKHHENPTAKREKNP